ncbi:hypothetical protein V6N13_004314 [Hibiscus sabdariffa]|uniref:Transmembrane protein n=1 Tax=Hibiscus sabdariffa TaxID=183260 RepID=A0ABR2RY45_9ROSI
MAEDPQKQKRMAAAAYDYENDPRWADYWSNILIPPHMASRSDVVDHFKRKFYQRYIDPDLVVETMSSGSPSQSSKSSASSSTSSAANDGARAHNAGSTSRSSRASAAAGSNTGSMGWDRQTIQFSVNAWVFIVAVLAIFPLVTRSLSNRAYRLSFMGTACSSLYSLYALYGLPRAWTMHYIQVYFQSIITTKDFIYFIYCLTFVTSHLCLKFALIPILCRALELVAKFLRRNFNRSTLYRKYLEDPCLWVAAQYHSNFHVLAAIEVYVPSPSHNWLPPKCLGEDREDSQSSHPAVHSVFERSGFCNTAMVVQINHIKMSETEAPVRFGIIGCANTARKLTRAINLSPNSVLHSVAKRFLGSSSRTSSGGPIGERCRLVCTFIGR